MILTGYRFETDFFRYLFYKYLVFFEKPRLSREAFIQRISDSVIYLRTKNIAPQNPPPPSIFDLYTEPRTVSRG